MYDKYLIYAVSITRNRRKKYDRNLLQGAFNARLVVPCKKPIWIFSIVE